jgi:hypothetical protein
MAIEPGSLASTSSVKMLQGVKGEISLTRGVGMAVNGDHATLFVELF